MLPTVEMQEVGRDDVVRIADWLEDEEVANRWFGRDPSGEPIHLGYIPAEMLRVGQGEWRRTFDDVRRHIFSVYTPQVGHIGEGHIVVEAPLGNAELAVLIGRKDLWGQGYGTATMQALLDRAFREYGAYRAWVDVPADNQAALRLCEKLGFVQEGRLRESRPSGSGRSDSVLMSLLAGEYLRRQEERQAA